MMTLDTLARMAERMPSEPAPDAGSPPYRFPDKNARIRAVNLPSLRDEKRRAVGIFTFVLGSAALTMTLAGMVATGGSALLDGEALQWAALSTAGAWYALSAVAFLGPIAAFALLREVRRYKEARNALGAEAWLDTHGYLHSVDGSVKISAADRG